MTSSFLKITLSRRAEQALAARQAPLRLELELFFSCLIRKQVQAVETHHRDARPLACADHRLDLAFRPVMTHTCSFDAPHSVEAFPLARPDAFRPRWLRLDYKNSQWLGEFGY
jgi:hypothetical protein